MASGAPRGLAPDNEVSDDEEHAKGVRLGTAI